MPWDYDNSFGIDYFATEWQYTDVLDWIGNTRNYCKQTHAPGETSRIPLVQNVLRNHGEDVPLAVELRDGDPVSELSQAGEAAASGAAVVVGM